MTDDLQPNLTALCSVLIALSTLFVSLRCWGAIIIKDHRLGLDDLFAALTLPFIVAENAVVLWWIKLGLGRHASALPPQNVAEAPRIIFIAGLLYELTITLPKLSALLFYNRMFGKTSLRYFHAGLWTLGFLNAGWFISTVLSTLFACKPVHKSWDPLVPGECVPQWEFFLGKALSSMIIDLGILALPMPIIWNLQVPTRKKLLIMAVFFFGYCVLFVSIGRLVSISKAGSWLETDITWNPIAYIIWVQLEGPVSVISVSLPINFQLIKMMHSRGFSYIFTGNDSLKKSTKNKAAGKAASPEQSRARPTRLSDLSFGRSGKETFRVVTAVGIRSAHPSQLTASEEDLMERGMSVAASNPDAVHIRQDVHVIAQASQSSDS